MSTLIGQRFIYRGQQVTISSTKDNGNTIFLKYPSGQEIKVNKKDLNSLFSNSIGKSVKKNIEDMQKKNDKYIEEQDKNYSIAKKLYKFIQTLIEDIKKKIQNLLKNNNTESEKYLCSNDKTKYREFCKSLKRYKDLFRSCSFAMSIALSNKFDACLWGNNLGNQRNLAEALLT